MSAYDLKLEDNAVKNIDAVYHHQLYTPSVLFFRSHCLWVCIFNIPLFYEKQYQYFDFFVRILLYFGICNKLFCNVDKKICTTSKIVYANYYSFFYITKPPFPMYRKTAVSNYSAYLIHQKERRKLTRILR